MQIKTKSRVCSYCHKGEDVIAQLFGSPEEYNPRAYICNECIAVCSRALTMENPSKASAMNLSPGPLADRFFLLVRNWLDRETRGEDSVEVLGEMRLVARELIAAMPPEGDCD